MFALVDVNGFCASCEKVLRPDLRNRSVVMLNNSGSCVIARSAEAERLGIKMGVPWFQLETAQFLELAITFSSNYELYTSMSNRVMSYLEKSVPCVEQYGIDKMFLDIRSIDGYTGFENFERQLREYIRGGTGLTIGVGTGSTKMLTKSVRWASKEWRQFGGVLALTSDNPKRMEKLLSLQPVSEIWGIDRRISKKLSTMGITTALQLARANPVFIREDFGVVPERTVRELNGEGYTSLEGAPPPKRWIVCSRSFGERVATYETMWRTVCRYAEHAAERLHGERQSYRHIIVLVRTSPFAISEPYYENVASEKLITPTQDTRGIIAAAVKALDRI